MLFSTLHESISALHIRSINSLCITQEKDLEAVVYLLGILIAVITVFVNDLEGLFATM